MSDLPGLDGVLGVEHVELTADKVVVRFTITERHLQPFGIPHGGIYCAVHESTASVAAQIWLGEKGVVVGTNNSTDFIRQAKLGDTITVTATRLVAQGQVRLANLDQPVPPEALAAFTGTTSG